MAALLGVIFVYIMLAASAIVLELLHRVLDGYFVIQSAHAFPCRWRIQLTFMCGNQTLNTIMYVRDSMIMDLTAQSLEELTGLTTALKQIDSARLTVKRPVFSLFVPGTRWDIAAT